MGPLSLCHRRRRRNCLSSFSYGTYLGIGEAGLPASLLWFRGIGIDPGRALRSSCRIPALGIDAAQLETGRI